MSFDIKEYIFNLSSKKTLFYPEKDYMIEWVFLEVLKGATKCVCGKKVTTSYNFVNKYNNEKVYLGKKCCTDKLCSKYEFNDLKDKTSGVMELFENGYFKDKEISPFIYKKILSHLRSYPLSDTLKKYIELYQEHDICEDLKSTYEMLFPERPDIEFPLIQKINIEITNSCINIKGGGTYNIKEKIKKCIGWSFVSDGKYWTVPCNTDIDFLYDIPSWVCCKFAHVISNEEKTFSCGKNCTKYQSIIKEKNEKELDKSSYLFKWIYTHYLQGQGSDDYEWFIRCESLDEANEFFKLKENEIRKTTKSGYGWSYTEVTLRYIQITKGEEIIKENGIKPTFISESRRSNNHNLKASYLHMKL